MKVTIEIKCDNAAFEPEAGTELARILHQLADEVMGNDLMPGIHHSLRDVNGNRVGKFSIQD